MKQADFDYVIRRAEAQGFRHQKTERGHHQFYAPDGKTIVTCGNMAGVTEWHADENFLADLKRAGYVDGLTTMGEALETAKAAEKKPNGGATLSVSQYVIDALSRHEEGRTSAELQAIVQSARPDVGYNAVHSAVSKLTRRGVLERTPTGVYKLTPMDRSGLKFLAPRLPSTAAKAHVNGAGPKPAAAVFTAGHRTGDEGVDRDLEVLDRALAALADIESVVRKNREVLAQLARLKEALGK
jgi:hypothetical protein